MMVLAFVNLDNVVMGKSFVVLGLAFVCSGTVWLLPRTSEEPDEEEAIEEVRPENKSSAQSIGTNERPLSSEVLPKTRPA
jgi:hypothetical protein